MHVEPEVPTVFEVVRRAAEVADPPDADEYVTALWQRFEDRDEPVTAVAPDVADEMRLALELIDPPVTQPAAVLAAAVATYLAFRTEEMDNDRQTLLRLAYLAELDGKPRDRWMEAWLEEQGVT